MQAVQSIRILVVDYRSVICSGLSAILSSYPGFHVIGHIEDVAEAIRFCEQEYPDIVCIDIDFPGETSGIEVIRKLRRMNHAGRIVVLTNVADELIVQETLRAGAISYLLKNISADELARAVRGAYQGQSTLSPEVTQLLIHAVSISGSGEHHLTHREHQVLDLITQGYTNREIAQTLNVSLSTVQFHVKNILAKLGVHNRIEAATLAVRQGIGSI
jgi:two-component system, NarL family, response regulator LiaR